MSVSTKDSGVGGKENGGATSEVGGASVGGAGAGNGGSGGIGANGNAAGAAGAAGATGVPSEVCRQFAGSYSIALDIPPTTVAITWLPLTATISELDGQCLARVTARYLPSVPVQLAITNDAITFDDSTGNDYPVLTTGNYLGAHRFIEYHFSQIKLLRGSSGVLTSSAQAKVEAFRADDDVSMPSTLELTGTVLPDVEAPKLRGGPQLYLAPTRRTPSLFAPSGGIARFGLPEDKLLPWERIAVEASEPIRGLASHLQLPAEIANAFADTPLGTSTPATDVWASSHFKDWDAVNGKNFSIALPSGLTDMAGNAVTQSELSISVLDVGMPRASHEMEDGSTLGLFGDVAFAAGVATITAPCGKGIGGIAGRLDTAGKSKVVVIVGGNGASLSRVLIDVTGRSGRAYTSISGAPEPTVDTYRYEVGIENEAEVGFSITTRGDCHWVRNAVATVDRVYVE